MFEFMEGQIITGQVTASMNVLRASSAMPLASLATMLAVAGAMTTPWAASAQAICRMAASSVASKRSMQTWFSDSTSKVMGPTNRAALLVMITRTRAPSLTNRLSSSTLL